MIYLASPYSHPNSSIRSYRFIQARRFVGQRMQLGEHVFSPIAYCHPIAEQYGLPLDHLYWMEFNRNFLLASSKMYVLMLDGWKDSPGVQDEIDFAKRHDFWISYHKPVTV